MRAAILRNGNILAAEQPNPEPHRGEVLVRTRACGICGSDLHAYHRARESGPEALSTGAAVSTGMSGDVVMGHEFSAELVDYGPGTAHRFAPGQLICSIPILYDGSRAHFVGYSSDPPGGYGEFMRLTEEHLIPVPNGLGADFAALTEPMAVGLHAVAKARLEPGDVPLVVGCGPVGLAVIAALKLKGAGPIIAADFSAGRRQLAEAMGADVVVDPAKTAPFDTWRELAQTGLPDPGPTLPGWLVGSGLKPAVVFECVGARGMIDRLMTDAPQDTRIIVVGLCFGSDAFAPMTGINKELNIQFSNSYTRAEFADTLHHIAEGDIEVAPLITGRVGVGGVEEAFHELEHPDRHAKILIEPWRD